MKILISQTASLGDVILSTPLIAALQRKYPQAELWFLTTSAGCGLIRHDKRLKGLISFDKKGKDRGLLAFKKKAQEIAAHRFDCVFAIQRSGRMALLLWLSKIKRRVAFASASFPFLFTETVARSKGGHEVERNLSLLANELKLDEADKDLRLFPPHESEVTASVKTEIENKDFVAIFPGSLWYTKRWSKENFAELGKKIAAGGLSAIYVGTQSEKDLVDGCAKPSHSRSLAGKTTLEDVNYLISKAKAVVCNDSSALHVASAFKIPTVAIFCATSPEMGFGPWRNPKTFVAGEDGLWCRPCARHGGKFCPTGTEACMRGVSSGSGASVDVVFYGLMGLLGKG